MNPDAMKITMQTLGTTVTECGAIHGPNHWDQVARTARLLHEQTPEANLDVALYFAYVHDAFRLDDYEDPDHGRRAAAWAINHRGDFDLGDRDMARLVHALAGHVDGDVSSDPTVGLCWDADRLDLGRVGLDPDPGYFSTTAGYSHAMRLIET